MIDQLNERFIPARAGNTNVSSASWYTISVYPRSRGEHVSCVSRVSLKNGLSPLARGTQSKAQ